LVIADRRLSAGGAAIVPRPRWAIGNRLYEFARGGQGRLSPEFSRQLGNRKSVKINPLTGIAAGGSVSDNARNRVQNYANFDCRDGGSREVAPGRVH
jgi:hypothetical protein